RRAVSPGDLCWVRLPSATGAAHPAIVLQSEELDGVLSTLLVVPLTDDPQALRQAGTLPVEPDAENGLSRSLVALVFHLMAVDRALVTPAGGRLSAAALSQVRAALARVTGDRAETDESV